MQQPIRSPRRVFLVRQAKSDEVARKIRKKKATKVES